MPTLETIIIKGINQGLHLFLHKAANTFNGARKMRLLFLWPMRTLLSCLERQSLTAVQGCSALSPAKTC